MTHGNSVVVPVEPTREMIDAGWNDVTQTPETIYRAMVTYAPAAPAPSSLVGGEVETLRTLLDNLVIAQGLSKEIRTHATDEARAYLYSEVGANRPHPCYGEHQPGCDCAFPAQTETEVPPFLKRMTDAKHEAPAEGAGEVLHDGDIRWLTDVLEELMVGRAKRASEGLRIRRLQKYLRARSSAPEARDEALGNLLAVIHSDGGHRALEVGTKQAALEAEKIVARLLSSAPEARDD